MDPSLLNELIELELTFSHPWALFTLLLVPVAIALAVGGGRTDHTRGRRVVTALVRTVVIILVALAVSQPRMRLPRDRIAVIFVVDHSDSIGAEELEWAGEYVEETATGLFPSDYSGLVLFAEHATIALAAEKMGVDPSARAKLLGEEAAERDETLEESHSDLASAVRLALAALPSGVTGRIVLVSDGNENRGELLEAGVGAAVSGVELHAATAPTASGEKEVEALALKMNTDQADPGETLRGELRLHSIGKASGTVVFYRNGEEIDRKKVDLEPGVSDPIDFEHRLESDAEEGTEIYEAVFVPEGGDTDERNNRSLAAVRVGGPPRVLIATGEPGKEEYLKKALESNEIAVDIAKLGELKTDVGALSKYDLIVLHDYPARSKEERYLTDGDMENISTYVREVGGGLVMIGGDGSYGPGGYEDTPVSKILPVKLEKEKKIEDVNVALMVILDISGSMNAMVGMRTRMWLANSGAVAAMKTLKPGDLFGLLAVDTKAYLVVPLQPPHPLLEPRIMKISAAGKGIYVYSALKRAKTELEKKTSRIKHVIVFSDATDAEEICAGVALGSGPCPGDSAHALASRMYAAGITVSTVGLGHPKDADVGPLKRLAAAGHGKFALTNNAKALPKIFVEETKRVATSEVKDRDFKVKLVKESPYTKGVDIATAPKLRGFIATRIKPTADLLMATPEDQPILASWRYGLGTVVAFTSDATDRWAANWLDWDGYRKFWAQVARTAAKKGSKLFATAHVDVRKGIARVSLEVPRRGGPFSEADAIRTKVTKVRPGESPEAGEKVEVDMRPVGPGRFEAEVAAEDVGYYLAEIVALKEKKGADSDADGDGRPDLEGTGPRVFGAGTMAFSDEYSHRASADGVLLAAAAATGGDYPAKPSRVTAHPDEPTKRVTDLWPWLVLAALLLVPFDLLLRRTGRWFGRSTAPATR